LLSGALRYEAYLRNIGSAGWTVPGTSEVELKQRLPNMLSGIVLLVFRNRSTDAKRKDILKDILEDQSIPRVENFR
jgi:hypothetical protein